MSAWFDGPPLVAGSVYGFRHFDLMNGTLVSPLRTDFEWEDGENLAGCGMGRFPRFMYDWEVLAQALGDRRARAIREHRVAQEFCSCGFYAYHRPFNPPAGRIPAVIEGYGLVSMGPKGFRAEKAKIVAVAAGSRAWVLWVLTLGWILFAGTQAFYMPDFVSWLLLPLGAIMGLVIGRLLRSLRVPSELREQMAKNYPSVKVYSSTLTMWWAYRKR